MASLAGSLRPAPPFPPRPLLPVPADREKNGPGPPGDGAPHSGRDLFAKYLTISAACLMLLLLLCPRTVAANSLTDQMGITRGVHDFTSGLPNRSDGINSNPARSDGCRFCHMPRTRDAVSYGDLGILWNEQSSTGANWRMYGSDPTMLDWIDGRIETAPTGSSKVCLSCHDGVIAVNQTDGRTAGSNTPSTGATLGYPSRVTIGGASGGLTNNHPISIRYAWNRDSQLHNPAYAVMGDGRSVLALLEDGRVECATCHDVHARDITSNRAMLRTTNTGANLSGSGASDLCLVCHDK